MTTHDHHLGTTEVSTPSHGHRLAARDPMPGPIAPIDHFDNDRRQILSRYVQEGLIPSLVLDGIAYVSYSDVYSDLLSDHFHSEFDSPAAWDSTYSMSWSPQRRTTGAWLKPRGFKDAVRSDMFPRISLSREARYLDDGEGERRRIWAAYPKHVADGAAEMFRALCREDGFTERFQQLRFEAEEEVAIPLTEFGEHEMEIFKELAAKGALRFGRIRGHEYIRSSELMYYDLFAAKIVEDEYVIDFSKTLTGNHIVGIMIDGACTLGRPFRYPTVLRPK